MDEREGTPMAEVPAPAHGVLGTLWLVAKKTGLDMQSFPIDADRVTIGRDWDSDIRLYFSDVSKLHCEIKFDPSTSEASIHVHGTHGVKHAPQSGELTTYKPPSIIPLSDRDTFLVRKKLFRFEYGHQDALIDTPPTQTLALPSDSPIKSGSPAPAERRKRVSHRMSLVPSGKSFEPFASPVKSRRHSIIGLGDGPQVVRTPKKSGLSRQIEEEEEQQDVEEEEEVVVEAVEGEEGDVLYFEAREEEIASKPVHNNPFMTPQQKRKAPMRNTSAVPRTRKSDPVVSQPTVQADNVHVDGTASPRTPRSVPLPLAAETPYGSVANSPAEAVKTPRSVPLPPADATPYVVSAQVAMSTPKGPVSLHKALLLRSARKAWQSSQAQGVDGAIQNGSVTTKRKSLSPSTKSRRSSTPTPIVEETQEEEEMSDEEADDQAEVEAEADDGQEEGELQWVYEDGAAAQSFDESDSSIDSLEADQSLDIPGQGILSFGSPPDVAQEALDEEEAMNGSYDESMEDEDGEEDSYEVQLMEEDHNNEQVGSQEVEEEDECRVEPELTSRPLDRFFTPQPRRTTGTTGPRRSLATIGGPATRLGRLPETPQSNIRRMPGTPGTLGLPSRRIAAPVEEEEVEQEEEKVAPSTPVRREMNPALLAEAQRRRETLGTPRAYPTLPPTFKTPVRDVSLRKAVKTPSHPALAPHTPEAEIDEKDSKPTVPLTPLEKVQKQLDHLRRQSMHRQTSDPNRRATVSFALPSTPARPQPKASASYTVVGQRRTFETTKEEDEDVSEPGTPIMAGQDVGDVSALEAGERDGQELESEATQVEDETKEVPAAGPSTPLLAGIKEMFRSAAPPKDPSFAGVRSMFASTPQAAPTPHYNGMKTMFQQPQEPATPHMNGMREMFHLAQEPATPDMEGLQEMYDLEEVEEAAALASDTESEEEEMVEEGSEIIIISSPPASPPAPKARPVTTTAMPKKTAASGVASRIQAPVASSSKVPAAQPTRATVSKVPVAKAPARTKATAPASVPEKKVPAPAKKAAVATTSTSTASRARAPAKAAPTARPAASRPRPGDIDDISISEIDEPVEYYESVKPKQEIVKPKTVSRTTTSRAKKVEADNAKAPAPKATASRAKKAVLGENEEQAQAQVTDSVAPAPAKATRARKAIVDKSATASTSKAASTTVPPAVKKTATRAKKVEKENEPEVEKPTVAAKKAPLRRTVKKAVVEAEAVEPVVTTRATRSRK